MRGDSSLRREMRKSRIEKTPMARSPALISSGVRASDVAMEAAPMPMKKMIIIPLRFHLSAIQPAGSAQTPKAMKPGVA